MVKTKIHISYDYFSIYEKNFIFGNFVLKIIKLITVYLKSKKSSEEH